MAEFTGERVIPGLVDVDLFNEHLARYRFAARFAAGAAVLDAGCGSGYGAGELRDVATLTAIDISSEALEYAAEHFDRPGLRFVRGSCEALPFAASSFDLITAFEVIEHLERWEDFLAGSKRVLKPSGILLVSTPNKAYYAEVRAQAGPNPFHCHEFEYAEFQDALTRVFPHVRMWSQNHADAVVFAPVDPASSEGLESSNKSAPDDAHFFVAACSQAPIADSALFAWLPSTANVLRERERHIAKLEGELARKDAWLDELKSAHSTLHESHNAALRELRERAQWAQRQDERIRQLDSRIEELQGEVKGLECENEERLTWVRQVQTDLERATAEIERLRGRERELEATVVERTEWALAREAELVELRAHLQARTADLALANQQLALIAQSKWIRLGHSLNLGPSLEKDSAE